MLFLDSPFAHDSAMAREQREWDEHLEAIEEGHAADERAPQVPLVQRDERRAA